MATGDTEIDAHEAIAEVPPVLEDEENVVGGMVIVATMLNFEAKSNTKVRLLSNKCEHVRC